MPRRRKTIVKTVRPQLVLSVDPGYSPRGELFDACLAAGLETITWNAAHKNNQLMLKRYSRGEPRRASGLSFDDRPGMT